MLGTAIVDGTGTKNRARVSKDSSLYVTNAIYPPMDTQLTKPFRQYLTLDGTPDGTFSMSVNGSVNNQDFYIESDNDNDIYITQLNFVIGYGAASNLYTFADSGAALTNGIRIFYTSIKGENDIDSAIKTNLDLLRLSLLDYLPSNWETRNFAALNDYGYLGNIDIVKIVLPTGIKLDQGSNQRLIVRIRDDLTVFADLFNFFVSGYERFEL